MAAGWASALTQAPRTEDAEQNQERHDHCALHFSRTAASKKITDDTVTTVEHALTKAYGTDLPVKFARELEAMKRASEQCGLALEWLAKFGDAPLDDSRAQRTVTPADLDYAKQSAQRAMSAAIGCAKRLFALAEITDSTSAVTMDARLPRQAGSALNAGDIDKALRTIASDEFQRRLTTGPTLEHSLQRGFQQARTVLQQAASQLADMLIPSLKMQQPQIHAQKTAELSITVQATKSVENRAYEMHEQIDNRLAKALRDNLVPTTLGETTPPHHINERVHLLKCEADMNFFAIKHAIAKSEHLRSYGPSGWSNLTHAEGDIADARAQHKATVVAFEKLRNLWGQANDLPIRNLIATRRDVSLR